MNFGGGYGGYQSVDSYGGGYGGGGFIQDSQGFPSPGLGASPGTRARGNKPQAIKPLTAAQLQTVEDMGENIFRIDGKEIGMVCVIGEVMEVKESPTTVIYTLDDRTGPWIKVQRWIDDNSAPLDPNDRSSCREGMYVKATGNIKTFNKQKSITAFFVRPLEDFNEVSHHLSDVLVTHLTAVKGAPVPQQFKDHQTSNTTGNWGAPMATSTQMGSYSTSAHNSGLNPVQQQVLNVITSCHDDHGINIHELVKVMTQHGKSSAQVKTAVDFLCNEGHIYSTVDDDHYKSTDS